MCVYFTATSYAAVFIPLSSSMSKLVVLGSYVMNYFWTVIGLQKLSIFLAYKIRALLRLYSPTTVRPPNRQRRGTESTQHGTADIVSYLTTLSQLCYIAAKFMNDCD